MKQLHTLKLSLRDWRKGAALLYRIGYNDNYEYKSVFSLELSDWDKDIIIDELLDQDIEFILKDEIYGDIFYPAKSEFKKAGESSGFDMRGLK